MRHIDKEHLIWKEAIKLRKELNNKFGASPDSVMGKCIIASDELSKRINRLGLKSKAYRVWVLYEDFEGCTDYCFEEHWMVCIDIGGGRRIYVDPTFNQFQWAFSRKLPQVYIGAVLPNWCLTKRPGERTLE
jgi:hypothetical protein